jgi:hypothetical protein
MLDFAWKLTTGQPEAGFASLITRLAVAAAAAGGRPAARDARPAEGRDVPSSTAVSGRHASRDPGG